jgi:hypothetical protein
MHIIPAAGTKPDYALLARQVELRDRFVSSNFFTTESRAASDRQGQKRTLELGLATGEVYS